MLQASATYERFARWLDTPAGAPARDEAFGPLEAAIEQELTPEVQRLCTRYKLPADALSTSLQLPHSVYVTPAGKTLRRVTNVTTEWSLQAYRSKTMRLFTEATAPFMKPFAPLVDQVRQRVYSWAVSDPEELKKSIRDAVTTELHRRVDDIEDLLVRG